MTPVQLPATIETERMVLQRLRLEDAAEIFYAYASKPEVTKYLSWPTHRSVDDTNAFLNYAVRAWQSGTDFSYAVRFKENSRMAGSFGVLNDNGKVQFGYAYSPSCWGQGIATEVCRALMEILKTTDGIYRIGTFVDVDNVASMRVLEKSGLEPEARLEKWFRFVNQGGEPKDCLLFKLPLR